MLHALVVTLDTVEDHWRRGDRPNAATIRELSQLRAAIQEGADKFASCLSSARAGQLADEYLFSVRSDGIVHIVAASAAGPDSLCGSALGELLKSRPGGPFCEACAKAFPARVFPLTGRRDV